MKRLLLLAALVLGCMVSSYAQTTVYFPQIADGAFGNVFFRTTIFIANPSLTQSADLSLTLTTNSGNPLNVSFTDSQGHTGGARNAETIVLGPGESRKLVSTAQAAGHVGFATLRSNIPVEANAIFSLFSGSPAQAILLSEAAVSPSLLRNSNKILFDQTTGVRTAFAYANPGGTNANITFTLTDTEGTAVQTTSKVLGAFNQAALFVDELFGGSVGGKLGLLRIDSDQALSVTALRFSGASFTSLPSFGSVSATGTDTFYFSEIADGTFGNDVFYKTTISVSNPASSGSASVTLTFASTTGAPLYIGFVDSASQTASSGSVITIPNLGPGQSRKFVSTAESGGRVGFAQISSSSPIEANATFSLFSGTPAQSTTLLSEAAIPRSRTAIHQGIFLDQSGGFRTAVALANSTTSPATVTFTLVDTAGKSVAATSKIFSPTSQVAFFVDELFGPAAVDGQVGVLRIDSDQPIAVVAFRFLNSVFTSMPAF